MIFATKMPQIDFLEQKHSFWTAFFWHSCKQNAFFSDFWWIWIFRQNFVQNTCWLRIEDWRLRIEDRGSMIKNWGLRTRDWGLRTAFSLSMDGLTIWDRKNPHKLENPLCRFVPPWGYLGKALIGPSFPSVWSNQFQSFQSLNPYIWTKSFISSLVLYLNLRCSCFVVHFSLFVGWVCLEGDIWRQSVEIYGLFVLHLQKLPQTPKGTKYEMHFF